MRPVPREVLAGDAPEVAPLLLNKVLVHGDRTARIVEVEAYRHDDPASHSFRGLTDRTRTMFGPAGHMYVYLSYGVHFCANVVCGADGVGTAVLLRAASPVGGVEEMRADRPAARADRDLLRGPGRLCAAMAIRREHDGADLVTGDRGVRLLDDGVPPPASPVVAPRVGISVAVDVPWRWYIPDDPHVSRR